MPSRVSRDPEYAMSGLLTDRHAKSAELQRRLRLRSACVSRVCCAAAQDKAPVAIAAIDIALFVNFKKDARVAKRSRAIARAAADLASPVAADTAFVDKSDFALEGAHGSVE